MPETSLVVRWGKYVTHALQGVDDPRRFWWTLSIRLQMEDILRPLYKDTFSGYLQRNTESNAVDAVLAKIREDITTFTREQRLSQTQREMALESFALYAVEQARGLHPQHKTPFIRT
jgi:hypothetical protein